MTINFKHSNGATTTAEGHPGCCQPIIDCEMRHDKYYLCSALLQPLHDGTATKLKLLHGVEKKVPILAFGNFC